MFGSERYGMANDDVYRCHAVMSIPTNPAYGSLNLAQAVAMRAISGVGLDVFENEPELADGLADLPNAFLLPHVGSAEVSSRAGMARKAAENAVAMARGEKPPYEVTP